MELPREVFTRGKKCEDKTLQGKDISGQEDFLQKEIYGVAYVINNLSDKGDMLEIASDIFGKNHINKIVGDAWFKDMLSNNFDYETWWFLDEYTKQYFKDFCNEGTDENPKCSYTYAKYIIPQLPFVIKRLKQNKYSRGAYISIFGENDVEKIGRRVGCTLSYGFSCRKTLDGDKLNLFLHMRSQDCANFMALDIYKAALLLEHVAKEVGVKVGIMTCYVDSLHLYQRDIKNMNITW